MRPMTSRRVRYLAVAGAVVASLLAGGWTGFDSMGDDQVSEESAPAIETSGQILSTYEACLIFSDMSGRECLDRFGA